MDRFYASQKIERNVMLRAQMLHSIEYCKVIIGHCMLRKLTLVLSNNQDEGGTPPDYWRVISNTAYHIL